MMKSLKALYHGTIKPMVFGHGEGDNYKSRGEMQNVFLENKIGALLYEPERWYRNLGTPIAQTADNERIEKIMPASNGCSKDITIQELKEYLKGKEEESNTKKYQFRSKNIPCVPKRTEQVGCDFLTNSPAYMVFPVGEKEFFEAKRNKMPHYRVGNGRKKENDNSMIMPKMI